MKLSDYVVKFLAGLGIDCVFGVTGGAVVHLFDSAARYPGIKTVFTHHEQTAALAAEAYSRTAPCNLGAAFFTTGPGVTNAVSGLTAAWLDSVPCIFISGQSRLSHTTRHKAIRQIGTQQLDIIPIVESLTKYSVMLESVEDIKYHLEAALFHAKSGRPGPVWIDIPLDMQWSKIDVESLKSFSNPPVDIPIEEGSIDKCINLLLNSKRPLVLAGYGVHSSGAEDEFRELIKTYNLPVLSSWNASDIIDNHYPRYLGRPGIFGQRGANMAIQNSDLILAVGSHLCLAITGSNFQYFARDAKVVVVDVDKDELDNLNITVDLKLHMDSKRFLEKLLKGLGKNTIEISSGWENYCAAYKALNAIPSDISEKYINPYNFIQFLSSKLSKQDTIVVDGGGTINQISFQSLVLEEGQNIVISGGLCSMGTALGEAIGACLANGKQNTICLSGDGSMQFNIQELQTIINYNLPIKIFVVNNNGYLAIRNTQRSFLEGRFVGSSPEGGIALPDFKKVAQAYGIEAISIKNNSEIEHGIELMMNNSKPMLCELMVSPEQNLICTQGFKAKPDGTFSPRPLEDMEPLLDRDEFNKLMITKPLEISE